MTQTPSAPAAPPPPPPPRTQVATADERPSGVTTACLILGILGVVTLLLGVVNVLFSSAAGSYTPPGFNPDVLGAGNTLTGVFNIVFGVVQLAAAILAWGGRDTGRLLGLVSGAVGIVYSIFGVVGLLAGAGATDPNRIVALVSWIVLLLAWALAIYAFWRNAGWFTGQRRTA